MGLTISKLAENVFGKKPLRLLLLGLDAAGKTSIFSKIALDETNQIPIFGFSVEITRYKHVTFTSWDIGGNNYASMRPLSRHYFQTTQGVVFVIDSSDRERIQ